jgi:DNA-binding MarR family transcriptional regulator
MESAQQYAATSEGGRAPELSTIELIEDLGKIIDFLKDIKLENILKELTASDLKQITSRVLSARILVDEIFEFSGFSSSPAWDLMLDLYLRDGMQRRTSVTDACLGARCPPTTGLRWLRALEDMGLVARAADPNDKRRTYVSLTETGRSRTAKAIRAYATR